MHFNVPRDWFETNSQHTLKCITPHQKRYYESGKKIRGCRGLLGRVVTEIKKSTQYSAELQMNFTQEYNSKIKLQYPVYTECTQLETARNLLPINSPKRDPNHDLTSY